MPQAIWNGHISFGLVEIPVAIVRGEEPRERIHFSLVDRRDHAPVGYLRVNKRTGEEVPLADVARGYPLETGDYVLFSDEELEQANPEATQTIEILDFIDEREIHPVYFVTPYLLEPIRKQASKPYALLREALRRTGRVAIASIVIKTREYTAALMPWEHALALVLLRYDHELRKPNEVNAPGADLRALGVRPRELEMAEQLIESMAARWEPRRYHDAYFYDVMGLVERKVLAGESEPVRPRPSRRPRAHRVPRDLTRLLEESVQRPQRERARHADGQSSSGRSSTGRASTGNGAPAKARPRSQPTRSQVRKGSSGRTA